MAFQPPILRRRRWNNLNKAEREALEVRAELLPILEALTSNREFKVSNKEITLALNKRLAWPISYKKTRKIMLEAGFKKAQHTELGLTYFLSAYLLKTRAPALRKAKGAFANPSVSNSEVGPQEAPIPREQPLVLSGLERKLIDFISSTLKDEPKAESNLFWLASRAGFTSEDCLRVLRLMEARGLVKRSALGACVLEKSAMGLI